MWKLILIQIIIFKNKKKQKNKLYKKTFYINWFISI